MAETKSPSWANTGSATQTSRRPPSGRNDLQERLCEIYGDCFALVLQLRATRTLDDAQQLRQRIKGLLEQAERRARQVGFSENEVHQASFAIVAFVDETVYSSDWPEKEQWQKKPLQLERFDRYDAGEEFFAHLEELRAHPDQQAQVLEVYYLCLALGFEGRYQLQGKNQLRMLIENTNEQLRRTATHDGRDGTLAPHGRPDDQTTAEMQYKVPAWAVAVIGLLLAGVLYLSMSFYVSREADEAVQTIERVQRSRATLQ